MTVRGNKGSLINTQRGFDINGFELTSVVLSLALPNMKDQQKERQEMSFSSAFKGLCDITESEIDR